MWLYLPHSLCGSTLPTVSVRLYLPYLAYTLPTVSVWLYLPYFAYVALPSLRSVWLYLPYTSTNTAKQPHFGTGLRHGGRCGAGFGPEASLVQGWSRQAGNGGWNLQGWDGGRLWVGVRVGGKVWSRGRQPHQQVSSLVHFLQDQADQWPNKVLLPQRNTQTCKSDQGSLFLTCMHTYSDTHTCTHTHMHTHTHAHTHINPCTHPLNKPPTLTHICTHPPIYPPTHTHASTIYPPTQPHTYQLTHPSTHTHTNTDMYPSTHIPTHPHPHINHIPTHPTTHIPTHPPIHTHTHTQSIHWGHIMITITVAVETRDWPCCQWPSHISSATSCLSSLPARSWLPATQCLHTELTATAGTASDPQGPYVYKHKQVTVTRCGRTPFLIFVSPISNVCVCVFVCVYIVHVCAWRMCLCVSCLFVCAWVGGWAGVGWGVCACVHMCVCVYVCVCRCMCMCVCVCACVCVVCACAHACACVCMCVCVHAWVCVHVYMCVSVLVQVCVSIFLQLQIYIQSNTDTRTWNLANSNPDSH